MPHVKRILHLLLLSGALPVALAQDAPATLSLDRDAAPPTVTLTATPAAEGGLFLPDCRGAVWELLDSDGVYRTLPAPACGPSAPPRAVPAGGQTFSPPAPPRYPAAMRLVVTVGTGCDAEQPFALAGCQAVTTLTGPNINLQAPPP